MWDLLPDTEQAYYQMILKRAGALLSSVHLNMLKFALSLRAYSATVHSFQQVGVCVCVCVCVRVCVRVRRF